MRRILATVLTATSLMGTIALAQDSEFPTLQELADQNNGTVARHGEWEIRCGEDGANCRMVQLALDADGNSVVSVTMQALPEGSSAQLGVVMVSPLLTLLPRGISVAVGDGVPAAYPFSWCDSQGCYARFGLTTAQVEAFKAGASANINIFAVTDAENPVQATLSLSGFTDAVADLSGR
ncbi:MAG: invasion associated locus B family protein [Rhodobacteraceae bacterium]|nr:invasion associated locus B family protein [Paracoccaceae bacterium]